jgi:hypothetical protein
MAGGADKLSFHFHSGPQVPRGLWLEQMGKKLAGVLDQILNQVYWSSFWLRNTESEC